MKQLFVKLFRSLFFKIAITLAMLTGVFIWICNAWIISSTKDKLFSEVSSIPANRVGLVLGANKNGRFGGHNLFFDYRINAAVELYKAGKISCILVSGDNHIKEYDEATDMQQALIVKGVPDSVITLDYAGFRTLDSVVRCKEIFGQSEFTIISQEFHNQRALFICNYYGIRAVAFNAKDVAGKYSYNTHFREYFSKCKAVLDLYVLKTAPKFLGEKNPI